MQSHHTEEWLPVVGYEAFYSVSNIGRVRRERTNSGTHSGRILKTWQTPNGYIRVGLCSGIKKSVRFFPVHRLVAAAFLGPPPDGYSVNHINAIKIDNRPKNLEYVTPAENSAHAARLGLISRGEHRYNAKFTERDIVAILTSPLPKKDLARQYRVNQSTIYKIQAGEIWKHVAPHLPRR